MRAAPLLVAAVAVATAAPALAGPLDGRLLTDLRLGRAPPVRLLVAGVDPGLPPPGLRLRSCLLGICTAEPEPGWVGTNAFDGLIRVEAGGRRTPLLDRALPAAGVPESWAVEGPRGEGVLVAVVDTGLDLRHPDFLDADGASRVLYLVDLSLPPAGAEPALESRVGAAVWGRDAIDAALRAWSAGEEPDPPLAHRDSSGHGTHVTAVAAGRSGVAPGASILAVRASRHDWPVTFEDADVLEGARLAFELADELGMPCVLLLALGGHAGGHDGTSLLELGLADLVGGIAGDRPGRAIVVAAGNGGGCQDHAGGTLAPDRTTTVELDLPGPDASLRLELEIWSPADGGLEVTLESPSGDRTETVGPGREVWTNRSWGRTGIVSSPSGPDPISGDRQTVVALGPRVGEPLEPGRYRVLLRGRGRFDAYLTWESERRGAAAPALASPLEPDGTLTVPATAEALIAVGATVSREGWVDEAGRAWRDDRFRVSELASYSASGPTRTGALKPDLVAPGHVVLAALSRDAEPPVETSVFTPASSLLPDRYRVGAGRAGAALWGTSVAAPQVAGVAAVLLGRDPELDQGALRSLLVASARTDGGAGGRGWSPRWGHGALDGAGALDLLEGGWGGPPASRTTALGVSDDVVRPGGCVTVTLLPRDERGRATGPGRRVLLVDADGGVAAAEDRGDGRYEATWCARGEPLGSAVELGVEVDGRDLGRSLVVHVAERRGRVGPWATAGGGCGVAAPRPRPARTLRRALLAALGWGRASPAARANL